MFQGISIPHPPSFHRMGIFWQRFVQQWHQKNAPSDVARDFSELLWLSTSATPPAAPLQGWMVELRSRRSPDTRKSSAEIPSSAVCLLSWHSERLNRVEYIWGFWGWRCNSFRPIVHLACFLLTPRMTLLRRLGPFSKCFGKWQRITKKQVKQHDRYVVMFPANIHWTWLTFGALPCPTWTEKTFV